jgi:multisubunit Na+/H+ antiporter MnhE subunit
MIRRCLPYPLLSVLLALIWLMFNQSLAPGTILLGAVLGIAPARAYGMLRPLSRKTKLSTGCAPIRRMHPGSRVGITSNSG